MSTGKHKNQKYKNNANGQRILYDARGARVKSSPLSNKYLRALLFWVIPYFVINGIILLLVCATPKISIEVGDTDDYVTTDVKFTIKSILPLKELSVSMESEELPYEKGSRNYVCTVSKNGTLRVEARCMNGMQRSAFVDIGMLDDTAPYVDESSANISHGTLTFLISDSQSGVNYDSIYGIVDSETEVRPTAFDKSQGLVTMELPKNSGVIELHFEDMVGNARSGRITVTVTQVDADDDAEAAEGEGEGTGDGESASGADSEASAE